MTYLFINLLFYPFTVSVNRYCGSCNSIDDPYDQVCVPDKAKNN